MGQVINLPQVINPRAERYQPACWARPSLYLASLHSCLAVGQPIRIGVFSPLKPRRTSATIRRVGVPMRIALSLAFNILLGTEALAQPIRIGVFSLFKPSEMVVTAAGSPLEVRYAGIASRLEGSQSIVLSGLATVTAPTGGPAPFILGISGKIRRRFQGTLAIRPKARYLEAIVTMDLEQAVASAVAAEALTGTPFEALKAQAVAARSYFAAARNRHEDYDACDSTHCQFLRELPSARSLATQATRDTAGLLLTYQGKPLAALYSASCGGTTRSLDDPQAGYPYYAVSCNYCQHHRRGLVEGHRYGLCQRGAAGMANSGATFRVILSHYYPGTAVTGAYPATLWRRSILPLEPAPVP